MISPSSAPVLRQRCVPRRSAGPWQYADIGTAEDNITHEDWNAYFAARPGHQAAVGHDCDRRWHHRPGGSGAAP